MTLEEQVSRFRPRIQDSVLLALGSPLSILDVIADFHLAESIEEMEANALREDWEIVGECIREAMRQEADSLLTIAEPDHEG